jgi:ribosomal protein L30E
MTRRVALYYRNVTSWEMGRLSKRKFQIGFFII